MDEIVAELDRQFSPELGGYPLSLPREFRYAMGAAAQKLSVSELRAWAEEGTALARHSLRSWEAAAEYFRVTPEVLAVLPFSSFERWAAFGRELAGESSTLATAYFRSAPEGLRHLTVLQMQDWAALGRQL